MNELISEHKLIASIAYVAVALVIRWLIICYLRKRPADDDGLLPKRWINSVKNATNLLIVIGLIIVWLSELRYAALSVAAFAVALVIATREFIQCFLGSIYKASTRTFGVGDWIRVDTLYGEVVHSDWLGTTLLEVDMQTLSYGYTGKTLFIPNNKFIVSSVENLNFMRRYVAHTFSIVRDPELINVFDVKAFILKQAREYCTPFEEVALRYNSMLETRMGISLPGPEAYVRITTNSFGKNVFTVTIFCPTQEAVNIEQKILEDFMSYWYSASEQKKSALGQHASSANGSQEAFSLAK